MKNTKEINTLGSGFISRFGLDTMFVLFFLALEYGRAVAVMSIDGLLMGTTMLMVWTLPYFLPSRQEKPSFSDWLLARGAVAFAGSLAGIILSKAAGSVLPDSVRFMPLTFLVLVSMASCYIQFYSLIRLRPAK